MLSRVGIPNANVTLVAISASFPASIAQTGPEVMLSSQAATPLPLGNLALVTLYLPVDVDVAGVSLATSLIGYADVFPEPHYMSCTVVLSGNPVTPGDTSVSSSSFGGAYVELRAQYGQVSRRCVCACVSVRLCLCLCGCACSCAAVPVRLWLCSCATVRLCICACAAVSFLCVCTCMPVRLCQCSCAAVQLCLCGCASAAVRLCNCAAVPVRLCLCTLHDLSVTACTLCGRGGQWLLARASGSHRRA